MLRNLLDVHIQAFEPPGILASSGSAKSVPSIIGGMKAVAEIQVVPIGAGVSVRAQVRRAQQVIHESGLEIQEHSFGTNVEGELETILQVVARIHEVLHAEGTTRLSTAIKLGTRTDKDPDLASKLR